jgi:two-component system LytT family sensor kinase
MANFNTIVFEKMRKFWLGIIISTFIGLSYFLFLFYSEKGFFPDFGNNLSYISICILAANLIGLTLYFSDTLLNKWISWRKHLSARLIVGLLTNSIISLSIIGIVGGLFLKGISSKTAFITHLDMHYDIIAKICIITIIAVVVYTVIYFALYSYNQYTVVHIEGAKNERKQLELQFEALKGQLSPHYLFNCLNTISSLVFKDPAQAEDFIRRLASSYQYIISNNEKRFVSLQQEVEFVKSYNYLLQVRFENNLKLDINLPQNIMDTKIPPLTMQMLVENAVKHNVINKDKPLLIYISAIDNTNIKISNTKTETPAHISSFHVGLDNIKKRYEFFTDKAIKIDDGTNYTVTLPVIHNKIAKSA